MLKNANEISKIIQNNNSVLVHCSDGWDRTAQLSSLSQMLLDPFYRTINGFAILVEKDWLSFGHQFGLRNGFAEKEKQDQASPIFLQFLDAVHQLLEQFPNAFEFNEKFLLFLAKNYNLNLYGTFMYNNEKERNDSNAKFNTASVWTEIFRDLKPYLNVYYDANSVKILEPNYSYYNLKIWTSFFMENNIYLENKHFYSDIDKNISFKSKQEFFAYKKKEDEIKYMDYQIKYEELLKVTADVYFNIKDNNPIFDKLSDESKKLIEELKPRLEKINNNRKKKMELLNKLKGKKDDDNKNGENNENTGKEEDKKDENEKKEESKPENEVEKKDQQKDENDAEKEIKKDNNGDEQKEEKKEEETNNEEIKKEDNNNENQNNEEIKEVNENEVKTETEQIDQ